jgi:hypothetical protein
MPCHHDPLEWRRGRGLDKKHEYRVATGSGAGLALLGWALPQVYPNMSAIVTYPAILCGIFLLLWGLWPPLRERCEAWWFVVRQQWPTRPTAEYEKVAPWMLPPSESFASPPENAPPKNYLSHRDEEVKMAIYSMSLRSVQGQYTSSQYPNDARQAMSMLAFIVTEAAMEGHLVIRGRPGSGRDYEEIPRTDWRLVYLDVEPNMATIWHVVVKPRHGVAPERVQKLLDYDSLVIDSAEFQKLWPPA